MSIGPFSVGEPAVAEVYGADRGHRPPKPRVVVVKTDERAVPEAR